MAEPRAVRVTDIHHAFGLVQAVRGVSFDVAEGEFLVLLGPSGSGKTTILRIIAGFEDLTHGSVAIRGREVAEVPPNRRDIGVVFQHFALFPHLTVFGNVAFGLEMRGILREELRIRVAAALEMVRLVGFDDRLPSQLSGGQQQRVALARALVTRPAVLLLDEPLGSLDPHLRGEMQAEILRLQRTLAIPAIMVTHDQQEAMMMADRIAVLHEGRLRQIGAPREIYSTPARLSSPASSAPPTSSTLLRCTPMAVSSSSLPATASHSRPRTTKKQGVMASARLCAPRRCGWARRAPIWKTYSLRA